MIRLILASLFSLSTWAEPARNLNVVTFNMKWFGTGGGIAGTIGDEFREPWIKDFSASTMGAGFLDADVLVLEEVVDLARVKLLVPRHTCHSYETGAQRHQHVVICLRAGLALDRDGGDDNYALEEVALNSSGLRPAVHGRVVDAAEAPLFHLIGVHLKAGRDESATRLEQARLIKKFIDEKLTDGLPVILTGDFNSFEENGDLEALQKIFAGKLQWVQSERTTYRGFTRARKFDLFFVSPELAPQKPLTIPDVCQDGFTGRYRFENYEFYSTMVSDHCPVKLTLN